MLGTRRCVLGAVVLGLLSGCVHKPPRVDCDGRLQPINQPAAVEGRNGGQSRDSAATAVSRPSNSESAGETEGSSSSAGGRSTGAPSPDTTQERAP
jgi:hypothetical protein